MADSSQRRGPGPRFVKGAFLLAGGVLLLGAAVQALWNAVLPQVLPAVQPLGYWQAVGLLVLCRLLVGGWGRPSQPGAPHRGPDFDKWARLSPDERQQFRQRWMGRRFGRPPEGSEEPGSNEPA